LDVVVMVVLDGEPLVDEGPGGFVEYFPDRIALTRGAEGEETEAGEGHSIVGTFADAYLGRDGPGDDFSDILTVEVELAGSTEVLAESKGGMAGFVRSGSFPGDRHDSAVGCEGIDVEFEEGLGLVQALAREILHAKGLDWGRGVPQSMPHRKNFVISASPAAVISAEQPHY